MLTPLRGRLGFGDFGTPKLLVLLVTKEQGIRSQRNKILTQLKWYGVILPQLLIKNRNKKWCETVSFTPFFSIDNEFG